MSGRRYTLIDVFGSLQSERSQLLVENSVMGLMYLMVDRCRGMIRRESGELISMPESVQQAR